MKYRRGFAPRRYRKNNSLESILGVRNGYRGHQVQGSSFTVPVVPSTSSSEVSTYFQSPSLTSATATVSQSQNKENSSSIVMSTATTLSSVPRLITQSETRAALRRNSAGISKESKGYNGWTVSSETVMRYREPAPSTSGSPGSSFVMINDGYLGSRNSIASMPLRAHFASSTLTSDIQGASSHQEGYRSVDGIVQSPWISRTPGPGSFDFATSNSNVFDSQTQTANNCSIKELIDNFCGVSPGSLNSPSASPGQLFP